MASRHRYSSEDGVVAVLLDLILNLFKRNALPLNVFAPVSSGAYRTSSPQPPDPPLPKEPKMTFKNRYPRIYDAGKAVLSTVVGSALFVGIATIVILLTSEIGHLMHGTSVYPLTDTSSEVMVGMLFTVLFTLIIGVGLVGVGLAYWTGKSQLERFGIIDRS